MRTAIIITYSGSQSKVSGPAPVQQAKDAYKALSGKDGDWAELWLSDSGVSKRKRMKTESAPKPKSIKPAKV
jgi:hypothetical protein